MHWETIHKDTAPVVTPNLADYDRIRSDFTWSQARTALAGLPGGGLDIAHEAVDRHAGPGAGHKIALRCIARDHIVSTVTYSEPARRTARFANVLRALGVGHGDRVFTLLGRCPEHCTTVLGTLRNTSVLCPLFSSSPPSGPTRWSSGCVWATPGCWSPRRPCTDGRPPAEGRRCQGSNTS